MDCGSQRSFTCTVTDVLAGWTISGFSGIGVTGTSGQIAAEFNARITTTNSGDPSSSTINITGFTTADNGGTIQCINLADNSVQGMASISVGEKLPAGQGGCTFVTKMTSCRGEVKKGLSMWPDQIIHGS